MSDCDVVICSQVEAWECTANNNITIRHAEVLLHPPYGPANGSIYTDWQQSVCENSSTPEQHRVGSNIRAVIYWSSSVSHRSVHQLQESILIG